MERHMDSIPFKTLRYQELEPTQDEKLKQMQHTLHHDPGLFLSKWGKYLSQTTLMLFKAIENDYEVDFYLNTLLYQEGDDEQPKQARKSAMHQLAQNRRYQFLRQILRHSDYYSDESIRLREPVLYDQYVGQHIPAQEKTKPFEKDMTLVSRIFSNMDQKYVHDSLDQQRVLDEEQFEEEEDDDESEDEMIASSTPAVNQENDMSLEETIEFREEQRLELIRLLEEKFLAGQDDFDYDDVDYNEAYDDLYQQEMDIQDKYFDEDE
ncbi:coiled-coil domain-containing protein-domain-containing protein [Blakeslea trispora]|nr:coiled-coil domain-containing protein-domain-containing protein [Blakeslea trispora]